ncbi:hypothetical protein [Sinomicrobium sp. M5D2P9]
MDFKTMIQLPVLETSQVLEVLQEIANKERNQERPNMPKVSISNSSGQVSGYFINYDADKGVILVGNWYDNQADLQYINFHGISSISVANIKNYAYLLSDGKIPFIPDPNEVPTMLQLKKEIKNLSLALKDTLGKELTITYRHTDTSTDTEKFYAGRVINLLKETLNTVSEDNLAKKAFTETVNTLHFSFSEENTVTLENDELHVSLSLAKGWKSVASKTELQDQIEKTL